MGIIKHYDTGSNLSHPQWVLYKNGSCPIHLGIPQHSFEGPFGWIYSMFGSGYTVEEGKLRANSAKRSYEKVSWTVFILFVNKIVLEIAMTKKPCDYSSAAFDQYNHI